LVVPFFSAFRLQDNEIIPSCIQIVTNRLSPSPLPHLLPLSLRDEG
jgi:hypothetical protein